MADINQRVKQRNDEPNEFIQENVERDESGQAISVKCWRCATPVAGFVDNETVSIDNSNGQRIVTVRQVFRSFANYTKAKFILDGGEVYTPIVCKDCVRLISSGDGRKFLNRDIAVAFKENRSDAYVDFLLKKGVSDFKGEHEERKRRRI